MWLKNKENCWPRSAAAVDEEEVSQEKKKTVVAALVSCEEETIFEEFLKFSDYHKILRVLAYVRRFVSNVRSRKSKRSAGEQFETMAVDVHLEEMESAEQAIIKHVQKTTFGGICHPNLEKLRKYEDANGMIRIQTKLYLTEKNEEFTCPLVL